MNHNIFKIENIELEITNKCEHRCPYCYVGDINQEKIEYCDYDTVCKVIQKIDQYGAKMIALLGGDPVLHPQIFEIMKYIKENTHCLVSVMSNTLDFADISLEQASNYIDNVDFTLHGRTAGEHEGFCKARAGSYNEIINRLRFLGKSGVNINIAINIIPETYNKIYEMVSSMYEQGVCFSSLLLQRIMPLGRACNNWNYDISKEQLSIALQQIAAAEKDFDIIISFEDPFPLCCIETKYHKYMKGCPEGINRLAIKGDGRISACGTLHHTMGNILTDSYNEIWENNPQFLEFRKGSFLSNKKCKTCEYKDLCRGGCPIRYMMSENNGEVFWKKFENEKL